MLSTAAIIKPHASLSHFIALHFPPSTPGPPLKPPLELHLPPPMNPLLPPGSTLFLPAFTRTSLVANNDHGLSAPGVCKITV